MVKGKKINGLPSEWSSLATAECLGEAQADWELEEGAPEVEDGTQASRHQKVNSLANLR